MLVDDWSDNDSQMQDIELYEENGEAFIQSSTPFFNNCSKTSNRYGERQHTKLKGNYIEHGFLSRLLKNEETDLVFNKQEIELFNCQFIAASALVEQRQNLFYILRQKIFEFERQDFQSGLLSYIPHAQSGDNSWLYTRTRQQCCIFFLYVSTYINRNLLPMMTACEVNEQYLQSWSSFPSTLRKDLNSLWRFLGPVSSLPNASFLKIDGASNLLSPANQKLHLHLELKLGVIETLWRLYCVQDNKSVQQLAEIEEKTDALLRDLILISNHVNKGSTPAELLSTTPFLCVCVKELWVIMIHFLDFLSTNHGVKSFWSALTMILNELLHPSKDQMKSSSCEVSEVNCKDPTLFCWWLLVHVTPLYWYNVSGEYVLKEKANASGNWILVQDLLRPSFLSRDKKVPEDLCRCYLSCCLQISQHWHPNNNVVSLLWDYFHKKMNNMFYLPNHRIQTPAVSRDTPPFQWFDQILLRCDGTVACKDDETSYELFLRILSEHLRKLNNSKNSQEWKHLKGRFYSKFNKKRMEELTEQGLLCFFNLFLTIACVGDLEDVTIKMLSFLDLLEFETLEFGKQMCVWKGYFVLLFVCKWRKSNVEIIAKKVSSFFTKICRHYQGVTTNKKQRQELWNLISVYLETGQELLEYRSSERLGDFNLIGNGFGILLGMQGDRELQILVKFIDAMLTIVSDELRGESKGSPELAQSLWEQVFPHIQKCITAPAIANVYLSRLVDIAAAFTLLSIEIPPINSSQTFNDVFRYFGPNDSMNASVSCQFLASFLASPQGLESAPFPLEVIHTWFRCSLQLPSQDPHLLNLTRIVCLNLPETSNIIKSQRSVVAGNVEAALGALTRNLGETFSSLEPPNASLHDQEDFREKALVIIGDFMKYIDSFLKQAGPPERLRFAYKVAACLVKDCSRIIYRRTRHDGLLPEIIEQLIVPWHSMKKPRHPAITQCIKLNMTEFLSGLAYLDFTRDEYIKRKMKQIFENYFHTINQECYKSPGSSPMKNPFVEGLKETFLRNPSKHASDFRQYVMLLVKEQHLIPGRTPKELATTLFFLADLFKRTLSPRETAKNTPVLFKNVLACLLLCDKSNPSNEPPHIRKEATKVLELMIHSCQRALDITSRDNLAALLIQFIFASIHNVQGTIFKVLNTLAKFDKDLIIQVVPKSKEAILHSERKRGVGVDNSLRAPFCALLENVGQKIEEHQF